MDNNKTTDTTFFGYVTLSYMNANPNDSQGTQSIHPSHGKCLKLNISVP